MADEINGKAFAISISITSAVECVWSREGWDEHLPQSLAQRSINVVSTKNQIVMRLLRSTRVCALVMSILKSRT